VRVFEGWGLFVMYCRKVIFGRNDVTSNCHEHIHWPRQFGVVKMGRLHFIDV